MTDPQSIRRESQGYLPLTYIKRCSPRQRPKSWDTTQSWPRSLHCPWRPEVAQRGGHLGKDDTAHQRRGARDRPDAQFSKQTQKSGLWGRAREKAQPHVQLLLRSIPVTSSSAPVCACAHAHTHACAHGQGHLGQSQKETELLVPRTR